MKIKYFIIVILLAIVCSQHEKLVIRDFKINGDIDALVDNYSENLFLIQLDLLNDSLYNLALNALPQLENHSFLTLPCKPPFVLRQRMAFVKNTRLDSTCA